MSDDLLSTPLRRSKRGQPFIAVPLLQASPPEALHNSWPEQPVYVRLTAREDLYDEEAERLSNDGMDLRNLKTLFYDQLIRKEYNSLKRSQNVYGRGNRKADNNAAQVVYKVGDIIFVHTTRKESSIAVITALWEVVGEGAIGGMKMRVHWFSKPSELPGVRAQREHYQNEIYYTLSMSSILPVSQIVSHCSVTTSPPDLGELKTVLAWSVTPTKPRARSNIKDTSISDNVFYCGYAIDSRKGIYYKFDWSNFREEALRNHDDRSSGRQWDIYPADLSLQSPRKKQRMMSRIREDDETEDGDYLPVLETQSSELDAISDIQDAFDEDIVEDFDLVPRTPSKKRKRLPSTPSRKRTRTTLAAPTPHSKAALRARANRKRMTVRPPPPDRINELQLQLESIPPDPWLRAMHVLHVAARPEALPCREEEYGRVLRAVEELLEEGSGGCVYISGVPGTGKTATVHAVVRELKRMARENESNPFTYVEINGLKIPEPSAAYGLLWEAISGHDVVTEGHMKISAKESLKQLSKYFSSGDRAGPGGHACVVLMDELDQLMTSKQDVVYNFFNWPTLVGSRLVVLAVANTMDLPERVMTGRVRSRLGMIRINFQPYTTPQLEKIVHARLLSAKEGLGTVPDVIAPDGVKFAAMKVSSISGDARRVLDICRRTVELVQPKSRTARTEDVKEVIKVMQNSPTAAYLRELSFHERLMLAALLKCIRKEGVEEIKWGDLQHQHIIYMNILTGENDPARRPTSGELSMVLDSLLATRAMLCEEGLAVERKSEDDKRVVLNLEHTEVERVLSEVGGSKWKNALAV